MSPHLLVQTAHEWRARLLRGWPPLPFWMGSCPFLPSLSLHAVRLGCTLLGGSPLVVGVGLGATPSVHAVLWTRTLLRGCHLLLCRPLSPWDPPLPLGHAMRWECMLPYGGVPPLPLGSALTSMARTVRLLRPCLPASMGGSPPPGLACHALVVHAAVPGGLPPLPGSDHDLPFVPSQKALS